MDIYDESDDITLIIVRFPLLPETMKDENGDWKVEILEKKEEEKEEIKEGGNTFIEQKDCKGEEGEIFIEAKEKSELAEQKDSIE